MVTKLRKRLRLIDFDYKGFYRYSVTICTHRKQALLCNQQLYSWLIDTLKDKSNAFNFKVWAYCFMPDHVHLLIEGERPDSDMRRFISTYKQLTGFYYKKRTGQPLWQTNYYDHILRKDEDIVTVAHYIFENPVRRGLTSNFRTYKHSGSFEFDISSL